MDTSAQLQLSRKVNQQTIYQYIELTEKMGVLHVTRQEQLDDIKHMH